MTNLKRMITIRELNKKFKIVGSILSPEAIKSYEQSIKNYTLYTEDL